ncbi:MAG TPA: DUF6789 family protein [Terriglobales bacterium]|jgi:hypothetical protein
MRRQRRFWKGAVAGLAGGLAGTIAMTIFQKSWAATAKKLAEQNNGQQPNRNARGGESRDESEDSTVKVAAKIASFAGTPLTTEQKKMGGSAVHYGFGATMGLLFGSLREIAPYQAWRYPALTGICFGTLVFLGADEIAVPSLNLSEKPSQKSASEHAYELAGHVIFGLTLGYITRAVRDRRWSESGSTAGRRRTGQCHEIFR